MGSIQDVTRLIRIRATAEGVDAATASLKSLAGAEDAVAGAAERQSRATLSVAGAVEKAQRQYDVAYRTQQQMSTLQRTLDAGRAQGLVSLERENELLGLAATRFGLVAEGMELSSRGTRTLETSIEHLSMGLASGKNPLELMMHSGLKLSSVLGEAGGVGGALKLVGSTIVESLVNPVTIMIGGFLAAGAAVDALVAAVQAPALAIEATLKAQAELVKQIRDAYGEAGKAATGYSDAAEAHAKLQLDVQKQAEDVRAELSQQFQSIDQQIRLQMTDMGGTVFQPFGELSSSVAAFADAIERGNPDLETFRRTLFDASLNPSVPAGLKDIAGHFLDLTQKAEELGVALRNIQGGEALVSGGGYSQLIGGASSGGMASLRQQLGALHSGSFDQRFDPTKANEAAARQAEAEARRQQDAINRVAESLQFQMDQLGRTDREQAIYNSLQAAGATATSVAGHAIADAAGHLYDMQEALRQNIETLDKVRDVGRAAFETIRSDIENGATAAKTFHDVLGSITSKLADMAENSALNALFGQQGSSSGGLFGSLFGSLLGGGGGGFGFNASTGTYHYHSGGLVGIDGTRSFVHPAYFDNAPRYHLGIDEVPAILQTGERVLSRAQVAAGAGGGAVHYSPTTNISLAGPTSESMMGQLRSELDQRDRRQAEQLPALIKKHRLNGRLD